MAAVQRGSSTRCRSRRAASPTRTAVDAGGSGSRRSRPIRSARCCSRPGGTLAIGMALKLARARDRPAQDAVAVGQLPRRVARRDLDRRRGGVPQAAWDRCCPAPSTRRPATRGDCRFGCGGTCNARCAEYIDYVLGKEEDVGAVIIETVRCTDVQIPPPEYYRIVRDACDRHGALLILDEVPICARPHRPRCSRSSTTASFPTWWCWARDSAARVFPMAALDRAPRPRRRGRPRARPLHAREELGRLRGGAGDARRHRRRRPAASARATLGAHALDRMRDAAAAAIRWSATCAASACCSASSSSARRRAGARAKPSR